jgi:heme/copper-type cytochrome/quinol oxidase subunit 2
MSFRFVDGLFWASVGCCVIAQVAILLSVLRAAPSTRANHADDAMPARRAIEIAWAVVPGFALAAVLFFTWRVMR